MKEAQPFDAGFLAANFNDTNTVECFLRGAAFVPCQKTNGAAAVRKPFAVKVVCHSTPPMWPVPLPDMAP